MTTAPDTGAVVVVIPSLHPGPDFPDIVRGMSALGLSDVLVIDDGSGADYAHIFSELAAMDGVVLLTHEVNRGKGAALKTALAHLQERADVVGMVTADSDGQHSPADIAKICAALVAAHAENPRVCVLGERDFDLPDLPIRSRIGNKLTTSIVRAVFGRAIPDTQTGLRGFDRSLFDELIAIDGDRFEYEMNALMYLLTHKVRIEEIPIETIYHDADNSQSHFRPVRDSLVIYRGLLAQGARFVLSSGAGAIVDLAMFTLIIDLFFSGNSHFAPVATATVSARIVSSLVNYTVNRHAVFGRYRRHGSALARYAVLAIGLLTTSTLVTTGLAHLFHGHVVWAKILTDSILFVVSFLIQKRWVFAPDALDILPIPHDKAAPRTSE